MEKPSKIIKMAGEEVTTGQAAADFLGVHPNTIRRWADEGYLPVINLPSGVRRFPINGLMEMAKKMKPKGGLDFYDPDDVRAFWDVVEGKTSVQEAGSMFRREGTLLCIELTPSTFDLFRAHSDR